jgi:E3 ubiquitin-protein ligase makorin
MPQNVNNMIMRNGSNGSFGGGGGGGYYHSTTTSTNSAISASMCGEWYVTGMCSKSMMTAEDGIGIGGCKLVHGEWCDTCEKYALHPTDEAQHAQHINECTKRHERLAARVRSAAVECGICLERVLEKSNLSDRRFGLLACDHPFCLPCIRNWRSKNDDGTVDVDTALRTCPVCRVTTYMVTPSVIWPGSKEEKDAIVEGYRGKLAATPCKYFAYGEGMCPFGTSCVYKHSYADGRLEDRGGGGLRRVAVDDGEVKVLGEVKLSDYISIRPARQRRRR